jgi:hypothetical protein
MCWVLLTGDASGVARISASRIFERAQPEQFWEPLKFPADSRLCGSYRSHYYGQIEVSEDHGLLWMRLPADGSLFTLTHFRGTSG